MTNYNNTTLYVGVTNSIGRRVLEHKQGKDKKTFSAKYKLTKLVYCECYKYINDAIAREKQIKAGPRRKKMELINEINPKWNNLSNEIF